MAIDRRNALAAFAGGAVGFLAPGIALSADTRMRSARLYLGGRRDGGGRHHVTGFDATGRMVIDVRTPARVHDGAVDPGGRLAILFARRPGTFAVVIDLHRRRPIGLIRSPDRRHFYGHGVFAPDGRLVYATENDFHGERGVLGVYRIGADIARVGEIPSHGVGPHDVRLLGDGRTLVVANGGILTRPSLPRRKLNLATMAPSLCFIDRHDGRLMRRVALDRDLHQASIRHLAVGTDGKVAFAMQYEGPPSDQVPLIGVIDRRGAVRLYDRPASAIRSLRQYCGSVAFDRSGALLAVTSPRGNTLTIWDASASRLVAAHRIDDVCGIAPTARPLRFMASSGRGGLFDVDGGRGAARPIVRPGATRAAWDNHLAPVGH